MAKRFVEAPAPRPAGGGVSDASRFQLLVQGIVDYAIYMVSREGIVTSWNAGAQRIKGYEPDEIIGQHFSRFFTPEDRSAGLPQRALAIARQVGRFESEGWRVRKDGSRFWVSAVLDAIHDEDGAFIGFAKITRDLTERQAAQQALIDSERRFRMLVQGVVDYAIYLLDPSGIVTNWNAGAERIKGYTAGDIVGRHFSLFYTPEERAAGMPAKSLATATREGKYETEGWRVRKDGTRFFASVVIDAIRGDQGEILGFAKVTRDITERRKSEEALRESERHFRLLVSGVTDYALYMLDPNGIVTSWNAGAMRIKGYSAEEIIGQHFSRFYFEGDRAAGVPARALATAGQTGRYEAEGWRVRKDGSFFWASVVIDAIHDEQGALVGFAKITRDITERREAQANLERVQSQLAEAQKMDALGQLTGGVAHDFNNLLMIVSGHIQLLKKQVAGDAKSTRAAEAIELATQRGASLTRQLLTFSRRQRVNPSAIALSEQIESFREVLASGVGGGERLAVHIPAATWPVKVDVSEFEIALVNLVVNARDATPEGGMVTITAENLVLDPSPGETGVSREVVALTVADAGVGIPEDVLPRIFDPFFTTKPVGKGTGLGLSQVYGFARQAGGSVKVESVVGKGTRVTMYLPRAATAPANAEVQERSRGYTGACAILLVEDNPEVADASIGLLEQLGCKVRCVADAEAALQALERDTTIDLVLSDIVMPGRMDGLALARAVKEKY
ncbi:MAG TPA: PAS domain S-box protein, partial [Xanthobacteraceae bacterium]|nr:PAS domain S-box protein [Xanthobacteraceae bacterium]